MRLSRLSLPSIHSVRVRLTLWNVLVMALLLLALGATLHYLALARLIAAVDDQLVDSLRQSGPPPPFMLQHFDDHGPGEPGDPPGEMGGPGEAGFVIGDGPDDPGRPSMPHFFTGFRFRDNQHHDHPGPHPTFPTTIAAAREQHAVQRGTLSDDAAAPLLLMPRYLSPDGQTMPPPGGQILRPWDSQTFAQSLQGQTVFSTLQIDGEPVRVYSAPLRYRNKIMGVVQSAATLTETEQEVNRITRNLLTLLPFALVGVALTGAFLTGRALRPVLEITQAAEGIEARNLSGRLTVNGNDEFARLATTFNGMLERLERSFAQQRRFTADASHELRTPLTIIKSNTGLALSAERKPADYKKTLTVVDQAADMMTRIVDDLLFLARSEAAAVTPDREPLLLDDVLSLAVGTVRSPSRAPILLDTADSSLRVLGDRFDLMRLFTNLLTNAARHTPKNGSIHVFAFTPEGDESTVMIEIADTGEGIAPEHLPHVFEAFYRADAARNRAQGGTGLGLPICRAIAEAHGGTITLESAVGQGTVARVRLPRFTFDS